MPERPVALITGAAKRLGRDIAVHLARQGFDLAIHYRQSAAEAQDCLLELRALGAQAHAYSADLSLEAECEALVPKVVAQFGRLDAVVNNASTFEHDTVNTFTFGAMDAHWRANTAPAIVLARALHAHVASHPERSACVVNLLDQKLWNLNPDHLSYTLSKAALQTATQLLAMALAPKVRVCGVAPGVTLPSGPMTAAEFAAAHQLTPLGRSSSPEDIVRAVAFLIESPAVTGHTLLVDGGQHLQAQNRDVMYLVNPQKEN